MTTQRVSETNKALGAIRRALTEFARGRRLKKEAEDALKKVQPDLVDLLMTYDPDCKGVKFSDTEAGYWQQNAAQSFYDVPAIIAWAKKRHLDVTTPQFDSKKYEALVAAGKVPAKIADGFMVKGNPPAPFVRLDPPKADSL